MKAIIYGAIIAVFSWASAGHAENASREKCTCDPKPGEVQDHGGLGGEWDRLLGLR